ncbi:MAG: hypothetical protein AAF916_00940 [Planctomycetota bacterium]
MSEIVIYGLLGVLGLALALAGLLYGVVPLLIRTQMRMRIGPEQVVYDDEAIHPASRSFFDEMTSSLEPLGYVSAGRFSLVDMMPNTRTDFVLLVHPTHHAQALGSCTASQAGDESTVSQTGAVVEFSTNLDDGRQINTNNSLDSDTGHAPVWKSQWVYPDEDDPQVLLQLHQAICEKLRDGVPYRRLPQAGGAAEFVLDDLRRTMDASCEMGLWEQADDGYAATTRGAYSMTWAMLPPFKGRRTGRVLRRCEQMRKSLGL